MAKTEFPTRARRGDPNGHMVVQQLLEFLRDQFDKYVAKVTRGTTTVAQGATTALVVHGLGNPTNTVVASPGVDPAGTWWVSNKTATQFQLNLAVAAPIGGVPFEWIVRGA